MSFYSTNEFKPGLKVLLEGDPSVILENEFVKPGKGQAFNRVKFRNLKTGRVWERTMKSGETLPAADVVERELRYLYNDGEVWHFMSDETFEQYEVRKDEVGEAAIWVREQDVCVITLWNDAPLSVAPPNFVVLQVVETDPGLRGDTSGGGGKPAKLETTAVVRVPLFVQIGDLVKVDTRSAEYVGRVSK